MPDLDISRCISESLWKMSKSAINHIFPSENISWAFNVLTCRRRLNLILNKMYQAFHSMFSLGI